MAAARAATTTATKKAGARGTQRVQTTATFYLGAMVEDVRETMEQAATWERSHRKPHQPENTLAKALKKKR